VHWLVYDIPPDVTSFRGTGGRSRAGAGRREPRAERIRQDRLGGHLSSEGAAHRYVFRLYAVGKKLDLPPGATRADVEEAMKGSFVGQAAIVGMYKRSGKR